MPKSIINSSIIPLAASETFYGEWERSGEPDIMVTCLASAACTLYIEFSDNGRSISRFPVAGFNVAANIYEFHTAVKGPRWFRVVLENGSSEMNFLNLNSYFGVFRQGNLPINQTIGADADSVVVRTVDSKVDLAFGKFGGMREDSKFGRVKAIDAADAAVDIWAFADDTASPRSNTKTFPTTAQSLYICSSSASDTAVNVTLSYIDADGLEQSVTATCNGQTPVDTGVTGLDVNRLFVSGSTAAVGKIYASVSNNFTTGEPNDVTDILALAPAGYQQSQLSHFTVPVGKRLRIKHVLIMVSRASGAAGSADVTLRIKPLGGVSTVKREFFPTSSVPVDVDEAGLVPDGGSQIVWRVDDVSDSDTQISCIWSYDLLDT